MQKYPNDYTLTQAAGKLEERLGNFTGARSLYGRSYKIQPSAPCLVALAQLELRQSATPDFDKVRRLFEEALLLDPRHGPAYNSYGNAEMNQGNLQKARLVYQRGVNASCCNVASVYHGYARLELSLGNVKRARRLLQKGRQEINSRSLYTDSPTRDRACYLMHTLGMLELNSNRPADALEVFEEGLDKCGKSSPLLLGVALCQVKLGNEDEARVYFERAVKCDDRHAQAWQAWGVLEMRAGRYKAARELFERGIQGSPKHGALWVSFAITEGRMGNVTGSRDLFARGLRQAPNHAPLYQAWASLELKEQNYDSAKALIAQALTRDKSHASGWLVAAEIESHYNNKGLMNLILRRGIECAPTSPALYKALGDLLAGQSKIVEAREVYEKGIEVDPMYAPLYHALAELEARVFNLEGLSRLNKKAAQFFNPNARVRPKSRMDEAWGVKIKASRKRHMPRGVSALNERIVNESDERMSPDAKTFLESIRDNNLLEQGLVGQLLSIDGES
jgi:tetratricopeptide (TPR) repeat protein